jgi:hypothetical protein
VPVAVTVVTAWDEKAARVGEYTWPNRVAYCARHGYSLRGGRRPDDDPHGGLWVKPAAISDALSAGDGWVTWLDADVLITAPETPLDWLGRTSADLVYSADINGLNCGVLFVRATDWSRSFVRKWLAGKAMYETYQNADQSAIAHLLHGEPREKWECWPQRTFNSYRYGEYGLSYPPGEWQPGDFALHLPGLSDERRLEIFGQFAAGDLK